MTLLRVIVLTLIVVVAGCAARQPREPVPPAMDSWKMQGRLALANGRDGGSGTLFWEQSPSSTQLQFHGALGRGSWRLAADRSGAVLTLSDSRQFRAPSVSELIERHIEWDIPVDALTHWVLGRPAPGTHQIGHGYDGHIDLLQQFDWTIEFDGYRPISGHVLPRKIVARRGGDEVRLIVSDWEPL